jgi:hypothetical protein
MNSIHVHARGWMVACHWSTEQCCSCLASNPRRHGGTSPTVQQHAISAQLSVSHMGQQVMAAPRPGRGHKPCSRISAACLDLDSWPAPLILLTHYEACMSKRLPPHTPGALGRRGAAMSVSLPPGWNGRLGRHECTSFQGQRNIVADQLPILS